MYILGKINEDKRRLLPLKNGSKGSC